MKQLPKEMYESTFIEQVIELMSNKHLVETAKMVKLKIPGFTSGKVKSIPEVILRTHLRKKLQNVKNAKILFTSVIGVMEDEYSGLPQEEFLYKLENDKETEPPIKLILLTYYFPALYKNEKDTIIKSLSEKSNLAEALLGEKDIKKELKALAALSMNNLEEKFPTIFPNIEHVFLDGSDTKSTVYPFFNVLKEIEKETFHGIDLDQLNQESYLHICILFIQKLIEKWEGELDRIERSMKIQENKIQQAKDENERLNKQLEMMTKEMEDVKTKREQLAQEVKNKEQALKKIVKEKEISEHQYKKEIEQLYKQLEKKHSNKEKSDKRIEPFQLINEDIKVFLPKKNEIIEALIGIERIFYFASIDQFSEQLKVIEKELVFIVTDGISTKDIFKMEKLLKEHHKIQYRLVSQGTQNIIRSIISYLEGEFRYEVVN
ncbi:hypothetical protein [Bacillus smithii]|uniref:hypothetical protein n=1 Tax=Bacillus smithii TaxID=1479 RepID=UPI002E1DE3C5|nr:hypothetical protein [Bacillus smithii]